MNETTTATPPAGRSARWRPAWLLLYFSGAGVAAKMAQDHHLPWPPCWIREFTGIPCPTCGASRSLVALLKLDFASAIHFNPLFSLGCMALTVWLAAVVFDTVFASRVVDRVCEAGKRWPIGWLAIGLVTLNWLYLCFNLPR